MQFVNYRELDKTIESLTNLRTQIKNDERIQMDNALALVLTRASMVRYAVDHFLSNDAIASRARLLAEAVVAYEKVEQGYAQSEVNSDKA